MKKSLLLFFLLTTCLFGFSQNTKKTVTIGVIGDITSESTKPLLVQLEKEIKAVIGQEATIIFNDVLENNFSMETAKTNYQTLLNNDTDIILSFGEVNTFMLYEETTYAKPIIAFGSINSDFITLPLNQETSEINNMNYLFSLSSYTKDLDAFHELFPYKKVGVIVDDFSLKILPVKKLFDAYFSKSEASYELISLQQDGSIDSDLTNIDAVYLVGGFNLNDAEFKALASKINAQKLPSFSGFSERDVERGILASNKSKADINQFFRRIALNVESIIAGVNPSELDTFIEYKSKLTINTNTASLIDFPLRYSMLATANFIGGTDLTVKSESSLSILDIMNGVLDKNLSLEVEKINVDLSNQDVKTARSNYLPDLTANVNGVYVDPKLAAFSAGQNPEFSTAGGVELNQLIYSESATAGIDIQKLQSKAQQETYNAAELDALLNASVAYFNALIFKANTKIQNQNLQITKENLELAQQNFNAGASGKSDVLRFRSQQAQNTQSLIDAGNQLRESFFTINQLLNNPIATKIDIDNAEISVGVFKDYNYKAMLDLLDKPKTREILISFLVEEAKNNAPNLKGLNYSIEANKRNYRLNNGGRFIPTVSLQGQYNLVLSRSGKGSTLPLGINIPDESYNVGINLSLPIFQQNQRNINRQIAMIQEDQLLIQQENTELDIETNVYTIIINLVGQIANIEISKISQKTAKESLELTTNEYQQGAVPVIQLIDAQNNYLQAQLASTTANYNYLLTSMQLEHAIGYFFLMHTETENQAFIQRANQYILNNQN